MKRYLAALAALALASLPAAAQFQGPPSPYIDNALTGGAGGSGMTVNGSNATAGTTKDNLQLVRDLKKDFGATCNGTADDTAAFTAASTWLATAPTNRLVTLPAASCATSTTVTLGDGRQQSTTLTALETGTPTTATVASCSGVMATDAMAIVRDAGTTFTATVTTCVGTTLTFSPAYSGGDASSGNAVFTGKVSSYNGGGFVGYGAGATSAEWPAAANVSTIKYIGAAAPTTTLGANANGAATSITVASIAGISLGTPIGITLDTAAVWWTWAAETPAGTTVKLGNAMPVGIPAATSGNTVIIANNPVFKIAGPITSPLLQNVTLDANSLAAIGLDARHPFAGGIGGFGKGILSRGYTAIGSYIHSGEFYAGTAVGVSNNQFGLRSSQPANNKTIGCWLRGTSTARVKVAFSGNRFDTLVCSQGGNDATAAGVRTEFFDNNILLHPVTTVNGSSVLGAGLYRQPSINTLLFPNENTWVGAALIGGVTEGTDQGGTGTLGSESMPSYSTYDGEPVPASTLIGGYTQSGISFGKLAPKDYFSGLAMSVLAARQIGLTAGAATDSTGQVLLRTTAQCSVSLNTAGAGGLDTGSVAASTWYAYFLIGPIVTGNSSCIATATTAAVVPTPTLPAGYSYYAYVGRAKTDGSSNLVAKTVLPRGQFYIDATGNSTYTPGASGFRPRAVRMLACGGAASGGSGARQTSGTAASGGTGGSAGGCGDFTYPFEQLSATVNVTVGAGGAQVTAPTTDPGAGNPGNDGAPTFFGAAAASAYSYGSKGCGGDGGRLNAAAASGGGGGGVVNTSGGFADCTDGAAGTAGTASTVGAAGSNSGAGPGSTLVGFGSAGAASTTASAFGGGSATSWYACAGGGSGGGITINAPINGGAGGFATSASVARGNGGTVGSKPGGSGATSSQVWLPGSSAGGGYGIFAAGGAGAGGAGGQCAGGGGGGSTINGQIAGVGGKGGDGYAFVWELQ